MFYIYYKIYCYSVQFVPPINSETILICPLCYRNGFLRKKQSNSQLPQKNKVINFHECLDFISQLYFKDFTNALSFDNRGKDENLPLKKYGINFIPNKMPLNKIKKFEYNAVKSIIRKCSRYQCSITYSIDLKKSRHLKDLVCQDVLSKPSSQNKIIFISRKKLTELYLVISIIAFKKCCELYHLDIKEDYEKEMVEGIKNLFYPLYTNVDTRIGWHFPIIVDNFKDGNWFNIQFYWPDESKYWNRCKNCKITYKKDIKECKKCHEKIYLVKEQPSASYKRNKLRELKENEYNMNEFYLKFINLMGKLCNNWFTVKEFIRNFNQFFDNASDKILQDLKMYGKTYYIIRHYDNEKSTRKRDCYIKEESDFMKISIKLKEYEQLMKDSF